MKQPIFVSRVSGVYHKILRMKLRLFFVCSAFAMMQSVQAQYVDDAPKKSVRVSEAALYPSFILQSGPVGTLEDFRKLAPGSMLLAKDYSSYTQENNVHTINGEGVFAANIGISFLNKKTNTYRNMTLRAGVSYMSSNYTSYLNKTTNTRFDTLNSSNGGPSAYLDSVRNESLNMQYRSQDLRADVAVIFRTKPEARWSLYGGIGFTVGASIRAYTDINAGEYTSVESTYDGTVSTISTYSEYDQHSDSERFSNKTSMGYSVYLPLGVDYRMANKSEFWKRLHLFYEAKPFVSFTTLDNIGTISTAGIQNGVGLRIVF